MRFLFQKRIQLLIVVVLTFLAYSNIFPNQFLGDDPSVIVQWPAVRSLENVDDFFVKKMVPPNQSPAYRPLQMTFLTLIYQFSKDKVWGYHFVSVLGHLAITVLVYLVVAALASQIYTKDKRINANTSSHVIPHLMKEPVLDSRFRGNDKVKKGEGVRGNVKWLPFIVALLFGLHPIHTEEITYMLVGVANISSIFFFGSFLLYLKRRINISATLALLAFFTYDITLTLPILLVLYELCFGQRESTFDKRSKFSISNFKFSLNFQFSKFAPYFVAWGIYLVFRIGIVGFAAPPISYLGGSFYHTLLLIPEVYVRYIWLLIFPAKLAFFHSLAPGVEVYTNFYTNLDAILSKTVLSLDVLASIFVLIFIFGMGIFFLRRKPLVSFCIGWFFICLIPVSGIVPVGPLMVERYLYLASFGFVLLFSYLLIWILSIRAFSIVVWVFIIFLSIFYAGRTYMRNLDWRTPKTFWSSQVRAYPKGLMGHFNLALYYSVDEPQKAIEEYNQILKIEPRIWETYNQRGNVFLRSNNLEKAKADYLEILKHNPDFLDAYVNLGSIYASEGEVDLAIEALSGGLRINKDNNKFFGNLAPQDELNFGFAKIYNLLGQIYQSQGKKQMAIDSFRSALSYLPGNAEIEGNLKRVEERGK